MNRRALLFLLLPALAHGQEPISIEEAVKIGIENQFAVRVARSQLEQAVQRTRQARGATGPSLSLSGSYTRFDREGRARFGDVSFVTSPIDAAQVQVTASLLVDVTGIFRQLIDAARLGERAAEENLAKEINAVSASIRTAYLRALQAEAVVTISREALQNIRNNLEIARRRFEAGAAPQFDVIRFESNVAQAEARLLEAERQERLAKQALANAMGRPIDEVFPLVPVADVPELRTELEELLRQARENRPELRSLRLLRAQLAKVTLAERRGTLPQLVLSGSYTRNIDPKGFGAREDQALANLTLNFPVFDSGITAARVRAAREDERQAEERLKELELLVELEVRQAHVRLENALAQVAVARSAVRTAEEALRIAQVRFEAGEGIQLEVSDAQTSLTEARVRLETARYDAWAAFADLARAIGSSRLPNASQESAS